MKRLWAAALLAAILVVSMTACAPKADAPTEPAAVASQDKTPSTAPLPNPLDELAGIVATVVRQINVYDGSVPPDKPAVVFAAEQDIALLLDWLAQIRPGEGLETPESAEPGSGSKYELVQFDGSRHTVSFSGQTISTGGAWHRYSGPNTADMNTALSLYVDGDSFSADTEIINYSLHNNSGSEAVILFVPVLERATDAGWARLDCTEGFCGVPDPMADEVIWHELPLSEWFPNAVPGVYRLSLEAYDEDDNPFMIADVFEIK